MRIYLQFSHIEQDQRPRYYQLCLQADLLDGWNVIKEWGHQGASGRSKMEHYNSLEEAQNALFSARDQQIQRGYRVMFVEGDKGL